MSTKCSTMCHSTHFFLRSYCLSKNFKWTLVESDLTLRRFQGPLCIFSTNGFFNFWQSLTFKCNLIYPINLLCIDNGILKVSLQLCCRWQELSANDSRVNLTKLVILSRGQRLSSSLKKSSTRNVSMDTEICASLSNPFTFSYSSLLLRSFK